jgi:predicted DNA-binding protein
MPSWPNKEGRTTITLELKLELVEHLDTQAQYLGQSRAAYIRQLIVRDMERQGPARLVTA